MHFGFSYVGLIFLVMLMVPNILWTKNQPKDYEKYVTKENKVLLVFERVGEMLVSGVILIFSDFNIGRLSLWSLWLLGAAVLMLLYEIYWIRYFRSSKTMRDFYCDMLGIPVPGASLPVAAAILIGIYGRNLFLIIAAVILGIGHIGIHWEHRKESSIN